MQRDNDIFAVSGAPLFPGFLKSVDDLSPEKALLKFIGCPHPPNRPDLIKWSQATDNSYIRQQITLVENFLIKSPDKPENIDDTLMVIGAFTLESSIYKLLNGWCNLSNRTTNDLESVSPYLKLLLQSLRRLPDKYRYKGIGIRVLDASIPVLKTAFDDYENHFAIGKLVNFYSVSSWGKHEKLLTQQLSTESSDESSEEDDVNDATYTPENLIILNKDIPVECHTNENRCEPEETTLPTPCNNDPDALRKNLQEESRVNTNLAGSSCDDNINSNGTISV